MQYQIDQSGKVENTSKNTVLCLSNDFWDAVMIKSRTKRSLQRIFRRNGQIRNFVLFTFCAGLAALIKRNLKVNELTIDREYTGKEGVIKNILLEMLAKEENVPEIYFGFIGKKAGAHYRALNVAKGELKTNKVLYAEEILSQIKMTEVGKRLKDA